MNAAAWETKKWDWNCRHTTTTILQVKGTYIHPGGVMGDKGGKKDKEKGQKQKAGKQAEKAKVKQEKDPKKKV